ncbi:MAG TPA: hypothetical protein VGC67_12550 [Cellulomonas sp.]
MDDLGAAANDLAQDPAGGVATVPVRGLRRALGIGGILVGDLVSAWLSLIPLSILWLVLLQIKADTIGPAQHVLDADEPIAEVLLIGGLLLLAALLPALIVSFLLGPLSGWRRRTRGAVAVLVVLTPYVVSLLSNGVWNFFVRTLLP